MRILVFILVLIGCIMSGFIGYVWMDQMQKEKSKQDSDIKMVRDLEKLGAISKSKLESAEEIYLTWIRRNRVWPFLYASAGLGLFAGMIVLARRGRSAAALLFAASLAPIALNPEIRTLIAVSALLLSGLLALLVKPRPSVPALAHATA